MSGMDEFEADVLGLVTDDDGKCSPPMEKYNVDINGAYNLSEQGNAHSVHGGSPSGRVLDYG